ncbi:RNA polymerase, sigma-24 subunit, ECF subfamily [Mucilaginibacter paludis DSM 18603]|uniref:RNA polymerase, sigma-24 subunit, ECF subfamily n=1 Tax=Mucilaginibacter paludis DSM 18603 TaxID=714943 RepID=H1YGT5_9SPHI|nr:RNA polymerase, sigma-24 subunit, ECF subfamily [Mucilaginibacter paludis DSM 18603]
MHFARLHQFALRHTNNAGLSEELAMDAMLKVWQKKDTLQHNVNSLAPLLFRILQFSIVDEYRKRKLEVTHIDELLAEPQHSEHADNRMLTGQLHSLYKEGFEKLSQKQKLVFEMRNDREMSYKDIANELRLSTKTVDRHLADAAATIRKHVSKFITIEIIALASIFV